MKRNPQILSNGYHLWGTPPNPLPWIFGKSKIKRNIFETVINKKLKVLERNSSTVIMFLDIIHRRGRLALLIGPMYAFPEDGDRIQYVKHCVLNTKRHDDG
jgi:hypothetical protein